MKDLYRVVQLQISDGYSKQATSSNETAEALDELLEESKPALQAGAHLWDTLISTPFRYDLPTDPKYAARFRPPYFERNVWYGAEESETSFYEASYHLMKERSHLPNHNETGHRTLFVAECDLSKALDIREFSDIAQIMNRHSYEDSYKVAREAMSYQGIIYPSCRDPKVRTCAAVYELACFAKAIKSELTVHFRYSSNQSVTWTRNPSIDLTIDWSQIN